MKTKTNSSKRSFLFLLILCAWLLISGGNSNAMAAEITSYYDVIECTYAVTESQTGQRVWASDLQLVRYGDIHTADGLDRVAVAIQDAADNAFFRLNVAATNGAAMEKDVNITTDRTEQFFLLKSAAWTSTNLAYKIYHPTTGLYLGYATDGSYTLQAYGENPPAYDFIFTRTGNTEMGKVREMEGFTLLTDHEKTRLFDICAGIGAYSVGNTIGYRGMEKLRTIYTQAEELDAKGEAEALRTVFDDIAFGDQSNWYALPQLPGASGVKLEIVDEVYGEYDLWRGSISKATKYTLRIIDDYATQQVDFYVEDSAIAIGNGKNALEAFKQIPYPLRKNIRNIYVRQDGANSYNCGANDFYIRISWIEGVDKIAMYMTHEFGHSMDFSYNLNDWGNWEPERNSDMMGVSGYGNSNNYEDFAEFTRFYFQCYGNANMMYGIRQVYPARYGRLVHVLSLTGYPDILAEKTKTLEEGSNKADLRETIAKAEAKAAKTEVYTAASLGELNAKLTAAKEIEVRNKATQEEVDIACRELLQAVEALVMAEAKGKIAEFTFDDTVNGFAGGKAVAQNSGTPVLSADAKSGNALSLSGDGANYLHVTKTDGTALLSDYEEVTISYWSKINNTAANWAFFAAPNADKQEYLYEKYLGILEQNGTLMSERYKNTGVRSASAQTPIEQNVWKMITLVVDKERTTLFVNGEKQASVESSVRLPDLLGDNSVLYIGKATWNAGEYFNGLIDEVSIYNYPMTNTQVKALYGGMEPTEEEAEAAAYNQKMANTVVDIIKKIGNVQYSKYVKERIDTARNAYEALTEVQKACVDEKAYKLLTDAEEAYQKAAEAFMAMQNKKIAHFSFDNETDGFGSTYAKAENKGTPVLTEDARLGKALYLDGTNNNYLKVYNAEGDSLLTGYEEITISYWSKVNAADGSSWGFYAAPDNKSVESDNEKYIGILDAGNVITAERYHNNGSRPASAEGDAVNNAWRYITIIFDEDSTRYYQNGEKISDVESSYALSDILKDESICFIGKANWNVGEYYRGYVDEFSIYNYALSDEEVADTYAATYTETAVEVANKAIAAIGTVELHVECKEKIEAARAAYMALTEELKAQITDIQVLTEAEKTFARLLEEENAKMQKTALVQFDFDDEENGFSSTWAKAEGEHTLAAHNDGNALYLDGTNDYLSIKRKNGLNLLAGTKEMTISLWAKPETANSNWLYYMAPDDYAQNYLTEKYVGLLDKSGQLLAERYYNTGARPETATANVTNGEWYHVAGVYTESETILYVNGVEVDRKSSGYNLSDIFGEDGVFYIGRANWNAGEYYRGMMDDVSVYNYAVTAEDVTKLYEGKSLIEDEEEKEAEADKAAAQEVMDKIAAIGTVEYTTASQRKIAEAKEAYEKLSDTQKALVTNLSILTEAEDTYKALEEESNRQNQDKAVAQEVMDKIAAIGTVEYTTASQRKIAEAKEAYEKLSDTQKALVTNLSILTTAEDTYKALEEENNQQNQGGQDNNDDQNQGGQDDSGNENQGGQDNSGSQNQGDQNNNSQQNQTGQNDADANDNTQNQTPQVSVPTADMVLTDNPSIPTGTSDEAQNATFGVLKAQVKKSTKNSNKIQWSKVADADGYVVMGNKCNVKGKKYKYEVLAITENNKTTSYTHKKLAKGTYYKYFVQAYKMADGELSIIATSKTML